MFPHFPSALSPFRNYGRHARRPSRLTLGIAAATVAALAGVTAGMSPGATSPVGAASKPGTIGQPGPVRAAGQAGAPSIDAASRLAPSRQAAPHTVPAVQHPAPARHPAPAQHPAPAPVQPAAPYLIYDSVEPSAIPSHNMIATYATGPYAVTPAQVAGRGPVMWIDVYGTDYQASALDVEPSDATPSEAASWAWHRLSAYPDAIAHIYTSLSEWPAVQAAVAPFPSSMRARIRWWIADPTGVPHIVPGSDATQWYWGSSYDITTATPRF